MAYGEWKIEPELTFKEFGYTVESLTIGSHKPVVVCCQFCKAVTYKRIKDSNKKHMCKSIIDGKKRCFKCKKIKNVEEEFSKNRSTFDGYQKVCKNCFANYDCVKNGYNKKSKKIKDNLIDYFGLKIVGCKMRCKKLNLPLDIDKEFLLKLYELQNGKCYYSNIEMTRERGKFTENSISIDRIDPIKGYVKENVVLCAYAINSLKGSLNEREFKDFLQRVLPALQMYSNKVN